MKTRNLTRPVVLLAALAVVAVMALAACGSPSNANAGSGASAEPRRAGHREHGDDGRDLHPGLLVHAVDHDGGGRDDGHLDQQ